MQPALKGNWSVLDFCEELGFYEVVLPDRLTSKATQGLSAVDKNDGGLIPSV